MAFHSDIHDKHMRLLEAVNEAADEIAHRRAVLILQGWRKGVEDCGVYLDLCDADRHYMYADDGAEVDLPGDGNICCGEWLDWAPGLTLLPAQKRLDGAKAAQGALL